MNAGPAYFEPIRRRTARRWDQLEDDAFIFQPDGEDFTEDHFTSICRFGYSNKRAPHTIGFRGVDFKNTSWNALRLVRVSRKMAGAVFLMTVETGSEKP